MQVGLIDVDTLARNWWVVLLRGIAGIVFGILTFAAPGISLAVLVLLFGAYAFVDGVLAIVTAIRRHTTDRWVPLLVYGIVGIGAGVVTLLWPAITLLALLWIVAVWAIVTGIVEMVAAVRLRKVINDEWLLGLSGLLSVALGVLLLLAPGPASVALVLWIGAYAFVAGIVLVALAFRLHSWTTSHHVPQHAGGMP